MMSPRARRGLKFGLGGLLAYLAFCQFFFITHAMSGVFRPLSSLVFIPAAMAQGESVSYHQVVELAHGLQGFGGVTKKKQAFDQALVASVYRLYVEHLAQELKVKLTNTEVAEYELDSGLLTAGLQTAHWNAGDYRKFIIEPLLLAQKIELAVSTDETYQTVAYDTMETLRKKVLQGMPFADVAENFSEDSSARARGDLGMMNLATLPVWLEPALELRHQDIGTISSILAAPDAFWTVTLIEFIPSELPEQATIHFRGLAVKKKSFGAVIGDMMARNPAWVFVW